MDNWRRSQYARMPRGKVYIPSGWNTNRRRGRPRRGNPGYNGNGYAAPNGNNMYDRFFGQAASEETLPQQESAPKAEGTSKEATRFHRRSRPKPQLPSPPAKVSGKPPAQERRAAVIEPPAPAEPERSPLSYPFHPVPPAYYPPPPPPAFIPCDEAGRPLSRQEIARIEAREAYEDKFGRDFYHYATSSAKTSDKEDLFPRNFLSESDSETAGQQKRKSD